MKKEFIETKVGHWHNARRKTMLAKYGESIQALSGTDNRTAILLVAIVLLQTSTAIMCSTQGLSLGSIVFISYVIGGFANQGLFFAVHEAGHDLIFETRALNRVAGFVANLPLILPMSVSFVKYHKMHHVSLGVEGIDPDLPTRAEVRILSHPLAKAVWSFFQLIFYVLRPAVILPSPPSRLELISWAFVLTFDYWLFSHWGWKPIAYCLLSSVLGSGYHPAAGHFIAEHYVLSGTEKEQKAYEPGHPSLAGLPQETYSYYGPMNTFLFNGGYHVEHHDFPSVPCWRLPELHKLAPEFYTGLVYHTSWTGVLVKYITDPKVGPHCRVVRPTDPSTVKERTISSWEKNILSTGRAEQLLNAKNKKRED